MTLRPEQQAEYEYLKRLIHNNGGTPPIYTVFDADHDPGVIITQGNSADYIRGFVSGFLSAKNADWLSLDIRIDSGTQTLTGPALLRWASEDASTETTGDM